MSSNLTSPTISEDIIADMKLRILYWLIVYDMWCEDRVKALLLWLEEWFSISQKRVEEGMIVLYLALEMAGARWTLSMLGINIATWLFAGGTMIWLHRKPDARRGGAKCYLELRLLRISFQVIVFFLAGILFFLPPHRASDIGLGVAQIVYLVFFYMTDISSNGTPGRRRKLALAELKKLFGAAWIPKPALEPQ